MFFQFDFLYRRSVCWPQADCCQRQRSCHFRMLHATCHMPHGRNRPLCTSVANCSISLHIVAHFSLNSLVFYICLCVCVCVCWCLTVVSLVQLRNLHNSSFSVWFCLMYLMSTFPTTLMLPDACGQLLNWYASLSQLSSALPSISTRQPRPHSDYPFSHLLLCLCSARELLTSLVACYHCRQVLAAAA